MTTMLAPSPFPKGHIRWVTDCVAEYRKRGYQPLPSRLDAKRPMITFGHLWEHRVEADLFAQFDYKANVQVMTGAYWGLIVVDLDGPEALAEWERLVALHRRTPKTWEVVSGSKGRHLWFAAPRDRPIPSGRLWSIWDASANDGKGDWQKHTAIEILADRKLAIAPPSIHPKTGHRYNWKKGNDWWAIVEPAPAPRWLLEMPVLRAPRAEVAPPERPDLAPKASTASAATTAQVLDAIPDKLALARSWGLKVHSDRENAAGWVSCHAADREDRDPSASFSPSTGRYWSPDTPPSGINLLDLAVLLGVYRDWRDARDHLAETYLGNRP